ncbi:hypothetical protein [Pseudonocardia parietis]|uniref:Uncharacterized protein n=1 Tax=Pseudonocardia parietis TaxID=570936 RepID=A0ABS4VWH8_9PSEU|nr:hypothetical protein [Pseudonocardia parietis]MBP2368254.1 hypothetical protein [Pseudonocardia parietis]
MVREEVRDGDSASDDALLRLRLRLTVLESQDVDVRIPGPALSLLGE